MGMVGLPLSHGGWSSYVQSWWPPTCVQKWRVFLPVETYSKFPPCRSSHVFRSFLGHPASLWESSACTFFLGLLPCRQRARTDLQHIGSQVRRAFCFRHFWYSGSGGYFTCGTTWRLSQGRQTAEANYCYPLKPVAGIYTPTWTLRITLFERTIVFQTPISLSAKISVSLGDGWHLWLPMGSYLCKVSDSVRTASTLWTNSNKQISCFMGSYSS